MFSQTYLGAGAAAINALTLAMLASVANKILIVPFLLFKMQMYLSTMVGFSSFGVLKPWVLYDGEIVPEHLPFKVAVIKNSVCE